MPVGKSPIGVAFGILWNGIVVRVKVATLKGVAFGISRTITKRLDLTSGSSLGFRLRPLNRRDPKPRRDRQTGNQKKNVRSATLVRKNGVRVCRQFSSLGTFLPKFADMVKPESGGKGRQEWRSSHAEKVPCMTEAPALQCHNFARANGDCTSHTEHDRIPNFLRFRGMLSDMRWMCPHCTLVEGCGWGCRDRCAPHLGKRDYA